MNQLLSTLHYLGIALIAFSVVLFGGFLTGVVDIPDELAAAESPVHSIARVAVVGCICAAVGSIDLPNKRR